MNTTRRILFGALTSLVSVGVASASSIISFTSNVVSGATELGYTLTLNKFDTNLGTLTGVRLVFKGSETSSLSLKNTSTGTVTFNINADANLTKFPDTTNSATAADKYSGENLTLFDTGIGAGLGSCSLGGTPAPGTCAPITIAAGAGQTTRSGTLVTTLSVLVKEVLPNGTLRIEGTRLVGINRETQNTGVAGARSLRGG